MDKPPPQLEEFRDALREWEARVPSLFVGDAEPGVIAVGGGVRPIALRLSIYPKMDERPYLLDAPDWHGHFETAKEACDAALSLLGGQSRIANEYRGESHSAAWRESWDGAAYTVSEMSMFLNPMDSTEWELWPGEAWSVHRTHMRLIELSPDEPLPSELPDLGKEQTTSTSVNEPMAHFNGMEAASWLVTWYGEPAPGMRWTIGPHQSFVVQLPRGWRFQGENAFSDPFMRFAPSVSGAVIFVTCYWKPVDERPLTGRAGVLPVSVEHTHDKVSKEHSDQSLDTWIVSFVNGEDEMKACVHMYQSHSDGRDLEWLRTGLTESLWTSRYVND